MVFAVRLSKIVSLLFFDNNLDVTCRDLKKSSFHYDIQGFDVFSGGVETYRALCSLYANIASTRSFPFRWPEFDREKCLFCVERCLRQRPCCVRGSNLFGRVQQEDLTFVRAKHAIRDELHASRDPSISLYFMNKL